MTIFHEIGLALGRTSKKLYEIGGKQAFDVNVSHDAWPSFLAEIHKAIPTPLPPDPVIRLNADTFFDLMTPFGKIRFNQMAREPPAPIFHHSV